MNKYDIIKQDMITALKEKNKLKRLTLADIISTIDKAAISNKKRVEITDELVNEVLLKYKKTVQEMIDTCPDNEKYADKKNEYKEKLAIVVEYAPKVIEDREEIAKIIFSQEVPIVYQNKKIFMPLLKKKYCDMKIAQEVLNELMKKV